MQKIRIKERTVRWRRRRRRRRKKQRKKTEEEMKDQRKVSQTNEERDDRRKENNLSSSVLKMDLSQHAINRLINRCDWNSGHHRACSLAICPPLQA